MSHFTVLSALALPEDIIAAREAVLERDLTAYRRNTLVRARLGRLSEATVFTKLPPITDQMRLDVLIGNLLDDQMAPYCENAEDLRYLEFEDCTDGGRSTYENSGTDCIRMPDGRILMQHDHAFAARYELFEGKIYQKCFGPLHHRKRTKKAARIQLLPNYPFKKLYRTFGAFMTEYEDCTPGEEPGRYGYYSNPNAQWDWYQIGGRWPFRFLVKEDCSTAVEGQFSLLFDETPTVPAPEGYR